MSSYELGVHKALLSKIVAAQAVGGKLSFMAATSIFPGIYPGIVDLPPESFPAISLMPDRNNKKFFTTGNPPAVSSGFRIKLVLLVNEGEPGLGLLGDTTLTPPIVGLYDFCAAVENVVEADQQLGNAALGIQKVLCESIDYKYDFYPTVMAEITVLITGQLTTQSN